MSRDLTIKYIQETLMLQRHQSFQPLKHSGLIAKEKQCQLGVGGSTGTHCLVTAL